MDYILHIVIFILIYSIIVQSLNLIMGYVGIVSMAHAVFCAVGAYTSAIISIDAGGHFIIGTLAGFGLAALAGALLAIPSLRVQDEYLIVLTVGFQMVMFEVMLTARGLTQGQGGIPGIPPAELFGFVFDTPGRFLFLVLVVAALCYAVAWRVTRSPFGRVLKAIREDESACRALGKNSLRFKVLVFSLGGGLAAVGGSMFAHYVTYISPFSFTVDASIFIIVMVVLGGQANFWGPLIGAVILVGLPEALRFVPGTGDIIDALREIFYGLILVMCMLFRPQGILPEYAKKNKKSSSAPGLARSASPDGAPANTPGRAGRSGSAPAGAFGEDVPGPGESILEIKGLSKSFGGLKAVDNVTMALPRGGITSLIGPNGCGKTTLFNLITGYLTPDHGEIYVRGKRFKNVPPYRLVGEGLARSWQDVRIFKEMTVLDNVLVAGQNQSGENLALLFASPWRVKKEEEENLARSLKMLELVGLLDKADHLASSLSNAEQKLVAIARLLATECPILLLDEPTAALDLDSVDKIIQLINRIARESGKTILLVEHNLDVVRGLAENAYFMSEGKILAHGTPAQLMADPKLTEVYFGSD